jgi:hypothetical protein
LLHSFPTRRSSDLKDLFFHEIIYLVVPEKFSNVNGERIPQVLQFRRIGFQVPEIVVMRAAAGRSHPGKEPALDVIFFVIGTMDAQGLFNEPFQQYEIIHDVPALLLPINPFS